MPANSTGSASGRRVHKPLKLFKNIDGASCPLANALSQNQVVKELTLTARKIHARRRAAADVSARAAAALSGFASAPTTSTPAPPCGPPVRAWS